MQALAFVVGREGAAGRALGAAADSPQLPRLARFLDVTAALRVGAGETAHRWEAEADRAPVERAARAAVDGALTGGGSYGGAAAGAWAGAALCGPTLIGVPAAPRPGATPAAGSAPGSASGSATGSSAPSPSHASGPTTRRWPPRSATSIARWSIALEPEVDASPPARPPRPPIRHADFVLDAPVAVGRRPSRRAPPRAAATVTASCRGPARA